MPTARRWAIHVGKNSAAFTTASESFGIKIQSLVRTVKGAVLPVSQRPGRPLRNWAAFSSNTKRVASSDNAKAADPSFQAAVGSLIDTLGLRVVLRCGAARLLATCEVNFRTMNAERATGVSKAMRLPGSTP